MSQLDTNALATEVAGTINLALMPLLERVASLETKLTTLDGVRDRVVAVETKCCGLEVGPDASVESRLLSAMERLSTLEYALSRAERHETMIAELKAQLSAAEATASQYAELAATARSLIERVSVMEAKSAVPHASEPVLQGLTSRMQALETRVIEDPAMKECAAIRERVAVVEMRASIPGQKGDPGEDGKPGRDGADGLGFDDLDVDFDGDRTITIKAERGTFKKSWPIVLPFQRHKGFYERGALYAEGDVVTWGGSQWYCNSGTTDKPGEGSKAWSLLVKCGRDGKDGKDAPAPLPVVTVR